MLDAFTQILLITVLSSFALGCTEHNCNFTLDSNNGKLQWKPCSNNCSIIIKSKEGTKLKIRFNAEATIGCELQVFHQDHSLNIKDLIYQDTYRKQLHLVDNYTSLRFSCPSKAKVVSVQWDVSDLQTEEGIDKLTKPFSKKHLALTNAANECNFVLNSNYGEIKADIPQDSNISICIRSNTGTKIRMTFEISDFGQGDCSLQLLNDSEVENFTESLTKQISSHNNEVDLQFTCRNYSPAREFSIVWKASNHLQPAARLPIIRTTYVEDTSTRTAVDITTTSKDIGQVQQITNYFQWLLGQMTKEQLVLMGRNSATSDSSKQGFHWMFGAGIVCGVLLISTLLLFVQRVLQYRKQRKLLIKSLKTDDRLKDDERKDSDGEDDSYSDVGGGMMQYESPNSQTKAKVFDVFHPNDSTEHTLVKRSHSYIEFIAEENTKLNANVHEETCDQYHMYEQIDDRERKETSTPENAKFYTSLTVTGETISKVHVLKKRPSSI